MVNEMSILTCSLEMSPADDLFLSGALDNSVRLWDLKSPNCLGVMQVHVFGISAIQKEPFLNIGYPFRFKENLSVRLIQRGSSSVLVSNQNNSNCK